MNGPQRPRDVAPTGLPIEEVVGDVREALRGGTSLVLTADPGAGKTTIVPLRLLGEAWLGDGRLIVLEPRRIAARAAARRMADLLGEDVGATVGVVTRDDRRTSSATRIEVVTEGVLTRRLQRDPGLDGVAGVIFDEFHERSLPGDVGLALTLDVQRSLRPDLRVVVMSATIDTERLAAHLGTCPVVASQGRTYPVEIAWQPLGPRDRLESAVVAASSTAIARGARGVLAFLPGAGEIGRVVDGLSASDVRALPLHGGLSSRDQDAALGDDGTPRVVVATDLAETSLTVPGIDVVVDAGLRRTPRFHPGSGMSRLVTVPISQASAAQRAGRAGRLAAGRAVRLWGEAEHGARRAFDPPALADADLTDLALQVAAWGEAVDRLPFLDQPPSAEIRRATALLQLLGLVDDAGRVTGQGSEVSELGLHPRLGRILLASGREKATAAMLVALLEERDLLSGPLSERSADLADRLRVVANARGRAAAIRKRARTLIRGGADRVDDTIAGRVLAPGYPDRIGRRSTPGRFVLTGGMRVEVADTDPLAREQWIVAAEIDGERGSGRLLRGAGLDAADASAMLGDQADRSVEIAFDPARRTVVRREASTVGPVVLHEHTERAEPGPEAATALAAYLAREELRPLPWHRAASALCARAEFARTHLRLDWPALDRRSLADDVDEWLTPLLWHAVSLDDVDRIDLAAALRNRLGHHRVTELDRLLPTAVRLGSGREVRIDYDAERPTVSSRVQDFYGMTSGPAILDGTMPLTLEMLSPAQRPVQVTADLAGFWSGSWVEVRKEMAGRYPKHHWPLDPTAP